MRLVRSIRIPLLLLGGLLLFVPRPAACAQEPAADAPLRPGDALLVRIEGIGGGIPAYREIVDSDGKVELPFLGFLSAEGKPIAELEAEMVKAYTKIATNAVVHITFVTHFDPAPSRQTLVRAEDPRRPVPVPPPPPSADGPAQ